MPVGILASCLATFGAGDGYASGLEPTSVFAQAGIGDQRANADLVGLRWKAPWEHDFGIGSLGLPVETALGRWQTEGRNGGSTAWPTQISVTPVLGFHPSKARSWFAEIGAGANYIVPVFQSGQKRFRTEFNFGDHSAIGREFGRSAVSVRLEHFSNAGISHPNPGEDFVQIRYSYRF